MTLLHFWFICLIGHLLRAVFLHLRNVLLSFLHSKSLTLILISAKTTDLSLICLSYPKLLSALFPYSFSLILNNLAFFPQISQASGLITLRRLLFSLFSLKSILLLTGLNSPSWLFFMFLQLSIWLTTIFFFSVLKLLMGYRAFPLLVSILFVRANPNDYLG